MQIIDHTLARLRYSTQTRTLAELALVRIANLENLDQISDLIAQLRGDAPLAASAPAVRRAAAASSPAVPVAKKKADQSDDHAGPALDARSPDDAQVPHVPLTSDSVDAVWQQALARLGGLVADNASKCESVTLLAAGKLTATFRARYASCKAFCERGEQLAALERALAEIARQGVKVQFTLLPDEPAEASAPRNVPARQRMAEVAEHPMIRHAVELFDAHLLRVDEGGP
jgi:DNA polymerase-3 subunit gamma/tau